MLQKEKEDTENSLVAQYEPAVSWQLKSCIAFRWQEAGAVVGAEAENQGSVRNSSAKVQLKEQTQLVHGGCYWNRSYLQDGQENISHRGKCFPADLRAATQIEMAASTTAASNPNAAGEWLTPAAKRRMPRKDVARETLINSRTAVETKVPFVSSC